MNLAESLNLGCACTTLRRDLLGLAHDVLAERPHLFSAAPVFISAKHHQLLVDSVAALHRIAALPGYQAQVLLHAPPIASLDFGPKGVFMGYDFHVGAGGPRLIEVNTNAGGALLHAAAARAHRACCTEMDRMFAAPADLDSIDETWIGMFRDEWRTQRGDAPLRSIAVVDDQPQQQYLAPEFELACRLFRSHGIEAVVADATQLRWRGGRLWHDALPMGMPVDMVYNRLTDFDLSQASHAALHDAYAAGGAVVTPHPRAHALHADKRNLVLLSDDAQLGACGAAAHDRALLRTVLPSTQRVTPENAADLWARRRHLFFKPATGYGSKAAYRGDKLTRRVWDDILAGEFVAQALVPPGERLVEVDGQPTRLKLDIRAYAYDGHVQLLAARTYAGQTTNFRTAGGGFSPVVVLPALDEEAKDLPPAAAPAAACTC